MALPEHKYITRYCEDRCLICHRLQIEHGPKTHSYLPHPEDIKEETPNDDHDDTNVVANMVSLGLTGIEITVLYLTMEQNRISFLLKNPSGEPGLNFETTYRKVKEAYDRYFDQNPNTDLYRA